MRLRAVALGAVALGLALGMIGGAPGISPTEAKLGSAAAAPAAPTAVQHASTVVSSMKVVNYYPASHGWTDMWTDWRPDEMAKDFKRIRGLGANNVRIIVFPYVFGWPTPSATYRDRFEKSLALADAAGLKVQLTLFDWWGEYTNIAASKAWLNNLLAGHRDDPRISMVELKNEVDPKDPLQAAWLKALMPVAVAASGRIPVTASISGQAGIADLRALVTLLKPHGMTVANAHYYGPGWSAHSWLGSAVSAAQGLPLFVGEVGYSVASKPERSRDANEARQAAWYRAVVSSVQVRGITVPAPWALSDFTATAIPGHSPSTDPREYAFGLARLDGSLRPAAAVVREAFQGGRIVTSPIVDPFAAGASDGLPLEWDPIDLNGATARWDGAVGRSGSGSASIAAARSSATGVPSLLRPVAAPMVPGSVWTARGYAKGSVQGFARIAIAWYDENLNYLGQKESNGLPRGQSGWTQLSVTGTVPAGAAAMAVVLKSADNPGTVWFDDITINKS